MKDLLGIKNLKSDLSAMKNEMTKISSEISKMSENIIYLSDKNRRVWTEYPQNFMK